MITTKNRGFSRDDTRNVDQKTKQYHHKHDTIIPDRDGTGLVMNTSTDREDALRGITIITSSEDAIMDNGNTSRRRVLARMVMVQRQVALPSLTFVKVTSVAMVTHSKRQWFL